MSAGHRDPGALTDAYHKARHLLTLLSGILATWEFLGISFAEFQGLKISAAKEIPVVIVGLVVYAGFRLGVEWFQCDPRRRDQTASIADLVFVYALSIFAVAVFGLQRATSFRLSEVSAALTALGIGIGVIFALVGMFLFKTLLQSKSKWEDGLRKPTSRLLWTILVGGGVVAAVAPFAGLALHLPSSVTVGLPIGAALCGVTGAFASGAVRKRLLASLETTRRTRPTGERAANEADLGAFPWRTRPT